MRSIIWKYGTLTSALCVLGLAGACSAGISDSATGGGNTGGSGGGSTTTGENTTATTGNTGGSTGAFMATSGTGQVGCDAMPDEDQDQDGFSINQGDCNDCDANVNPGAIEVIVDPGMGMGGGGGAAPADENCDGNIDEVVPNCDSGLPIDSSNPIDAARALDICQQVAGPQTWGLISAQYVRANGTAAPVSNQWGLLPNFGPNVAPRGGDTIVVMSSGRARIPGQAGSCGALTCTGTGAGTAPPGFPQDVPSCSGSQNINDDVGLDLTLKAPTNATGYRFDFDFYSFEYPEWVCTSYNDQFIALVNPAPMGSINGNVTFDSQNNPVSVNIAFFDVCQGCALGTSELQGTGFDTWDDAGATSWLQTTAPIAGGDTFNIRFAIWDTGDASWDSTVLVDNFQWIANGGTVNVGTNPVPE